MATDYNELHATSDNNSEVHNNQAEVKLEDFILEAGNFLDSKARISLIGDNIVAQNGPLENIRGKDLNTQLSKDGIMENCEKYNSVADIKSENCIFDTEDIPESVAGIPLINGDFVAQNVSLENIKSENLDGRLDEDVSNRGNCEKNCKVGIEFVNCLVQTGNDDNGVRAISSENIKVEKLDDQCDKNFTCEYEAPKVSHNLNGIPDCAQCGKSGERPFTCNICRKSFFRKNVLVNHMQKHTDEMPFTCETCKKPFRLKSRLRKHMMTHTGEKPFTCEICKKSFTYKHVLLNHIRSHTGEKPFTCEICKKNFSRKGTLMIHIKKHAGEKPLTCEICNRSFSRKQGLSNHLNAHAARGGV